jgi:hypothetical protein
MAGTMSFYDMICYLKTVLFSILGQQGYQIIILKLYDVTTLVTNQQLRVVLVGTAIVAGNKAVLRLDFMDKALLK